MAAKREKSNRKSFSLIEVCISIVLIAMILAGMVNLFGQGFLASRKVKGKITAYSLLREELENKSGGSWPPGSMSRAIVNATYFPGFERQVVCTNPYAGYNELALINVTVWWDNGTKNQSVYTLRANY
jgi:hypothetical protein